MGAFAGLLRERDPIVAISSCRQKYLRLSRERDTPKCTPLRPCCVTGGGRTVSVAEPLTAPTVAVIVDVPVATGRIAGGDHRQWAVMVKVWVLVAPYVLV